MEYVSGIPIYEICTGTDPIEVRDITAVLQIKPGGN